MNAISPSAIIAECAREFWVTPEDVTGRSRDVEKCDARHVAMWLLYRVFHMTTGQAARYFGRERSMVSHAARRVQDLSETDARFNAAVKRIRMRIDGISCAESACELGVNGNR